MKQRIVLSSLILIYILSNCGSDKQTLNNFLPNATGTDSEMLIVMDSSKFKMKLGRSIVNVFGSGLKEYVTRFEFILLEVGGYKFK